MPDALAFWYAVCCGTGRHLLGLPGFFMRQPESPKSCASGRTLRTFSFFPESHQKEQVLHPPGCGRINVWIPELQYTAGKQLPGQNIYSGSTCRDAFLSLISPGRQYLIFCKYLPECFSEPVSSRPNTYFLQMLTGHFSRPLSSGPSLSYILQMPDGILF